MTPKDIEILKISFSVIKTLSGKFPARSSLLTELHIFYVANIALFILKCYKHSNCYPQAWYKLENRFNYSTEK